MMVRLIQLAQLEDRKPAYAEVNGLDLVVVKYDDQVSVLYGRCMHRGDLSTFDFDLHRLNRINYAGVHPH